MFLYAYLFGFIYLFLLVALSLFLFRGINTCKFPWCYSRLVQLGEETALEGPHSILQEDIEKKKTGSSLADSRRMRGKEHQLYQERACLDKELLSHHRDRQEVEQVAH